MLSKRERNQLYETIVAEGLDPAEFSIEDKFFRAVVTHSSGSTYKLSPGQHGFQVIVHVEDGIDATVDELNVESIAVIGRAGFGNAPFTEGERRQIATQFLEIQIKLDQFQLPSDQMSQVAERLTELEEASRHLGRKDWLIIFITTISPLVVDDIVTPGLARHICTLAINGLIHLFGGRRPQVLGGLPAAVGAQDAEGVDGEEAAPLPFGGR
jgi:hypothetical protein